MIQKGKGDCSPCPTDLSFTNLISRMDDTLDTLLHSDILLIGKRCQTSSVLRIIPVIRVGVIIVLSHEHFAMDFCVVGSFCR